MTPSHWGGGGCREYSPVFFLKDLCHGERVLSHIEAKLFILYGRFDTQTSFFVAYDVNGTGMILTLNVAFPYHKILICLIYDCGISQESSLVFAVETVQIIYFDCRGSSTSPLHLSCFHDASRFHMYIPNI